MNIKLNKLISIAIIFLTIVLAVISFFVLPDTVITQVGGSSGASTMPKETALLIPTALGLLGGGAGLLNKSDKMGKETLIGAVGILVFILMLIFNLVAS